jgi:hypothetical protein
MFTVQSYTVNVSAPAVTPFVTVTTPSSNPEAVPTPVILAIGQRTLELRVDPPAIPNGEIGTYVILANGAAVQTGGTAGNFSVDNLTPHTRYVSLVLRPACQWCGYTYRRNADATHVRLSRDHSRYEIAVRVCTRATATAPAGCTVSNVTNATTAPARPEGQGAPAITVDDATSLTISWAEPAEPNSDLL